MERAGDGRGPGWEWGFMVSELSSVRQAIRLASGGGRRRWGAGGERVACGDASFTYLTGTALAHGIFGGSRSRVGREEEKLAVVGNGKRAMKKDGCKRLSRFRRSWSSIMSSPNGKAAREKKGGRSQIREIRAGNVVRLEPPYLKLPSAYHP